MTEDETLRDSDDDGDDNMADWKSREMAGRRYRTRREKP